MLLLNSGKAQCFRRRSTRYSPYGRPTTRRLIRYTKFVSSCLRIIAVNRRCSLSLSDCTFLRENFLYLQAPRPSPMRGRRHGGAVTDEVEALAFMRRSPPHQSPPATASPHRGSHWACILQGRSKQRKPSRKKVQPDEIRLHLLFAANILRQLVTNLIPPYQAARSKTPVR